MAGSFGLISKLFPCLLKRQQQSFARLLEAETSPEHSGGAIQVPADLGERWRWKAGLFKQLSWPWVGEGAGGLGPREKAVMWLPSGLPPA